MIQLTELLYAQSPAPDFLALKARVEEILGNTVWASDPADSSKAFLIRHTSHPVKYKDAEVPGQTAILRSDKAPQIEALRDEITQSWRCENPADLLSGCQSTLLITEMMARALPHQLRLELFHGVLRAAIEVTEPKALVFKHTQQIVDPADYLEACDQEPIMRPGSLNVRFFNISNSPGDKVMDTRGLTEIGLHDLQCHFRKLEPQKVSTVLYNTAVYLFEQGPVIESGQTVAGIAPKEKWVCQFEDSLLEPTREILDLNPGSPYAAGNR